MILERPEIPKLHINLINHNSNVLFKTLQVYFHSEYINQTKLTKFLLYPSESKRNKKRREEVQSKLIERDSVAKGHSKVTSEVTNLGTEGLKQRANCTMPQ